MECTYSLTCAANVSDETLENCARLFSEHYGVWGKRSPYHGRRVRMTRKRLVEEYLFSEDCFVVTAHMDGELIGHILARRFPYERIHGQSRFFSGMYPDNANDIDRFILGTVVWITQLVVNSEFRGRRVATKLMQMAFNPESDVACGMVTSHPHAVRALERAFSMKVDPVVIMTSDVDKMLEESHVP